MFECVVNLSEGRRAEVLDEFARAAGASLADRHADSFHHRSVFTLINDRDELVRDVRALIGAAFDRLDLATHEGVHPRFGVVDVVPFVALDVAKSGDACEMRNDTAHWIADTYDVPCFYYGPVGDVTLRTLPEVRRHAFRSLAPDVGPASAHPRWGASAVGCRPILVAWNLWLENVSLEAARAIATRLRRPALRTLALPVGHFVQVSCNVVDVSAIRLSQIYDDVLALLSGEGRIARAELVGLAPTSLLEAEDPSRLVELDLAAERTIEARA